MRHRWDIEGVEVSHPVSVTTGNLVQTAWIVRLGWLPGGGSRDSWWQLECQQLKPCSLWQQGRLGRVGRWRELGQRRRFCLLCTIRHGRLRALNGVLSAELQPEELLLEAVDAPWKEVRDEESSDEEVEVGSSLYVPR